jgi:hypothetical protein
MTDSILEPFTPQNTTVLMVDYSAGFVNTFRSHNVNEHITATVALAKTALGLRSGLVVNLGAGQKPYPQLVQAGLGLGPPAGTLTPQNDQAPCPLLCKRHPFLHRLASR